ncbi:Predicted ATP-binding protein involved in virulence [Butyrivibrio proteoclasticus]|uniref:Predicted ATP-binding protein involved in virulence n=2 Tax=Butyrivibrio proteoclasticus TaxID=43305 RepID=A0A1I5Q0K1_9FIRM|nr:Predicted ATP-binding protein involved in virulence [Butyrivibrio proteoclasticus]
MFLKKLELKNFRGIEAQNIDFNDGINLIIGNNGAGKTSILSAIANTLSIMTASLSGGEVLHFNQNDVRCVQRRVSESIVESKQAFPIEAKSTIDFNGISLQFGQTGKDILDVLNLQGIDGWNHKDEIIAVMNGVYPLISYQRFDREWKLQANENRGEVVVRYGTVTRESGYEDCLSGTGYEDIIQKWCLTMALMEYERKSEIREFKAFQRIVEKFIQELEDNNQKISVYYSSEVGSLVYESGDSRLPLYDLSTGYRAIMSMIMELAYRSVILNPEICDDIERIEGIVLIDEIDAHLHPKWQWRILDALKATFPSVQFIVATHSPMVIASVQNVNIINLDVDNGVTYLESAYGFSAGDVLTLRQGTTEMPMEAKKQLDELDRALDEADDNRARAILEKALSEYGENSAFYNELYQMYKLNSWMDV